MPDENRSSFADATQSYLTFSNSDKSRPPPQQNDVSVTLDDAVPESDSALFKDEDDDFLPGMMVLGSSIMFTLMQCLVRYVTKEFHTPVIYVSFYCGFVKTVMSLFTIAFGGKQLWTGSTSLTDVGLVVVRGVFGAIAIITNYAALQRLPVGVTTCLSSMTPVVTSVLGWMFLREDLTFSNYILLGFITMGSVLVGLSEPFSLSTATSSQHIQGVLFSLLTALSIGCVYVIMRHLGSKAHVIWIVFSVSASCMITPLIFYALENGIASTFSYVFHHSMRLDAPRHIAMAGVGLTNFIASLLLNYGCRLIRAGKSAILMMLNIPLSFLIALLFLGEFPTSPLEISGCLLIAMCTYITAINRSS